MGSWPRWPIRRRRSPPSPQTTQTWQPEVAAVGSLRAVNGADAVAGGRRRGRSRSISSRATTCRQGQVLLRLRADDDTAKLAALEASAALAQVNYDRDLRQFRAQAVSQAVVDTDNYNLKNARAQVDAAAGGAGREDLACAVRRASGHPCRRSGPVPQPRHRGRHAAGARSAVCRFLRAAAGAEPCRGGPGGHRQGRYLSRTRLPTARSSRSTRTVDTDSRNVQMRASLPNPDHRLLPGMFATIDIAAGAPEQHDHAAADRRSPTTRTAARSIVVLEQKGDDRGQGKPQLVASRPSSPRARRAATRWRC